MANDQSPYDVILVDLSVATPANSSLKVFDVGIPMGDVFVLQLPAAAVGGVFLRIGSPKNKQIPLRLEGQNFHIYQTQVQGGLYIDCPVAFPGATLILFVGIQDLEYFARQNTTEQRLLQLLQALTARVGGGVRP
jgi:hypothetical protein